MRCKWEWAASPAKWRDPSQPAHRSPRALSRCRELNSARAPVASTPTAPDQRPSGGSVAHSWAALAPTILSSIELLPGILLRASADAFSCTMRRSQCCCNNAGDSCIAPGAPAGAMPWPCVILGRRPRPCYCSLLRIHRLPIAHSRPAATACVLCIKSPVPLSHRCHPPVACFQLGGTHVRSIRHLQPACPAH
jgi:hypothetical protein